MSKVIARLSFEQYSGGNKWPRDPYPGDVVLIDYSPSRKHSLVCSIRNHLKARRMKGEVTWDIQNLVCTLTYTSEDLS